MSTDPTCAERIASQMAGRADDVRKMLAAQRGETVCKHCGQVITKNTDDEWVHADGDDFVYCYDQDEPTAPSTRAEPHEDIDEDSLSSFGLEVTRKVTLKFLMSTGGPGDWLEILCGEEKRSAAGRHAYDDDRAAYTVLTVERVTYHFSDWFDHAEENVPEGSPLFELAEWVAEGQS